MKLHEKISAEVSKVRGLVKGSGHYLHLVENGVDRRQLDAFIDDGCALKTKGSPVGQEKFTRDLERMFDLRGAVAGGGAMARIFGTHKTRDYDVFLGIL